jgi:pimeloyl-ACP methyl ester carboxylesterase
MNRRETMAAAAGLLTMAAAPALARAFRSDRLTVTVRGTGPDVILIPGLTSHPEIWAGEVAALQGSYRLHLVHVGGFSGAPAGAAATGPVAGPVADELARYVKETGLKRPAVIGHSLGGAIGLMMAARHPQAVGRLMVVDMLPNLGPVYFPTATTPEAVRTAAEAMRQRLETSSPEQFEAGQRFVLNTMVQDKSRLPMLVNHALTSDRSVTARAMYELQTTDLRPELSKITAPVTVVHVWNTVTPWPKEAAVALYESQYAGLKGVKRVLIEDSAHFVMFDQPQRFHAEVASFLSTN